MQLTFHQSGYRSALAQGITVDLIQQVFVYFYGYIGKHILSALVHRKGKYLRLPKQQLPEKLREGLQ